MTDETLSRITEETRTLAASERRLQAAIRSAQAADADPRAIEAAMRKAAAGRPDFRDPVEARIALEANA